MVRFEVLLSDPVLASLGVVFTLRKVKVQTGKKVKYSFGYPKNDFTRPGYDDKVRLCEVIDFKTKEGKQEFHCQTKLIEEKHVELMKEDFLRNTELYINTLKDKRSALERAHMDRVLLIQKEKRKLEEEISEINEKILEARKHGELHWSEHKKLLLRDY